jgi:hypothetical protein
LYQNYKYDLKTCKQLWLSSWINGKYCLIRTTFFQELYSSQKNDKSTYIMDRCVNNPECVNSSWQYTNHIPCVMIYMFRIKMLCSYVHKGVCLWLPSPWKKTDVQSVCETDTCKIVYKADNTIYCIHITLVNISVIHFSIFWRR